MDNFEIATNPIIEIKEVGEIDKNIDLGEIFWRANELNIPLVNVSINFGNKNISYYPANIGQCIADIIREYFLTKEKNEHVVEFSGYPLALSRKKGKNIEFYTADISDEREFIGAVDAEIYLDKLKECYSKLYDYYNKW